MKKLYGALALFLGVLMFNVDAVAQYCTPSTSSSWGRVTNASTSGGMMNFSKNTGTSNWGVRNFTASDSVLVQPGMTFTLSVNHTYGLGVWADWNDDGDFNDPGEQIFRQTSSTSSAQSKTISVTVPSTASLGQLRMRLMAGYYFYLRPCGYTSTWGSIYQSDVEDYRIHVVAAKQNDAAITEMTPSSLCSGSQNVSVRVVNFGSDTLKSVTINGSVDTTNFTGVTLTGMSIPQYGDTVYTLGSYNFSAGVKYDIKAYSSSPNSSVDSSNANDTLFVDDFQTAMTGSYTVGLNASDDFNSIQSAVNTMQSVGVCGPVEFLLYPGVTYAERVSMGAVNGASSTNTITFKTNMDSTGAYAYWSASGTSTQNYLLRLNGSSHVILDSIKFRNNSTSYSRTVALESQASYITIKNDSILGHNTTSSWNREGIYGNGRTDFITIENNYFYRGGAPIYSLGPRSVASAARNWVVKNNVIEQFGYYAVYFYYTINSDIEGNTITNGTLNTFSRWPLYVYYSHGFKIVKNKITTGSTTSYSRIYIYRADGNSFRRGLFANNFVSFLSTSSSTSNRFEAYYADNTDYINNSFWFASCPRPMYLYYGTGTRRFINNAVHYEGTGTARTTWGTWTTDYNCWYAPNGSVGSIGTNSINANPEFNSSTDLHANSANMHNAGDTSWVSTIDGVDIDGDIRCPLTNCPGAGSAPDMGADEYWLPDYDILPEDAGDAVCSGTQDVRVRIKNRGLRTLTSFNVDWWIGGVAQTQLSVTGISIPGGSDTVVTVGTNNFVTGTTYNFTFATSNPSGQTDQVIDNDTLRTSLENSLSGTFTVGSGGAYPGLDSIANHIAKVGICGPVTIQVMDSTFTENIEFTDVVGNSSTNTISIVPAPTNTGDAIIDGRITLEDMTHVTIKGMTFTGSGNKIQISTTGMVEHLRIDSNMFDLGTSGYALYSSASRQNLDSMWFRDNMQNKGTAMIYLRSYGGSGTPYNANLWITGNEADSLATYGVYLYGGDEYISINNNDFRLTKDNQFSKYGVYAYYTNNLHVTRNNIWMQPRSGGRAYGMYLYRNNYYRSSTSDSNYIVNNFITIDDETNSGFTYGMYVAWYNRRINIWHNNVYANTSRSYGMYDYYNGTSTSYNMNIRNNVFYGRTNTYYAWRASSNIVRDYNVYWNGTPGNWGTSGFTRGTNSMNTNPRFKDPSKGDLRVNSIQMDSAAVNLGIMIDHFGNSRNVPHHDIGAHEFDPCYFDAVAKDYYSRYTQIPLGQSVRMYGTVGNVGLDSITGVNAFGSVGSSSSTLSLGTIPSDGDTSFSIAVPVSGATGIVNAELYTTMSQTDCDNENDTIRYAFEATDSIYAYDDSSVTGGLGYTNNIGEFGSVFEIFNADTITSGTFYLASPPQGATVRLMVYEFDTAGPGKKVDSTRAFQVGANGAGWYTLQFGCNGIAAQPGSYLVCVDQPNPVNMSLGYSADGRGVAETRWSRVAGGNWIDMYTNGNTNIKFGTLLLRVNLGELSDNDVLPATTLICNNSDTYIKPNKKYASQIWSNGLLFDSILVSTPGTYAIKAWDQIGCEFTDTTTAKMADPMTVTTTPTRATCGMSDGSAMVSATGSYGPHTYTWSDGSMGSSISNVAGGDYQVTVTDSIGCENVQDVQVLGAYPDVTASSTYPTCNGDQNATATATVNTGVMPYTYAWDNGGSTGTIANLAAGTYIVTVTDAACSKVDTVVIMDPPVLTVSGAPTSPSACKLADGALQANTAGGMAPYSYLWSNGQTGKKAVGLTEGVYDVTVTDDLGCVTIAKMQLTDPNSPIAVSNDQNLDCSYDTTTVSVTVTGGTAPFSYRWDYMNMTSENLAGVGPGTYKLHLVDNNGCDHDTTVVITAPSAVNVNFTNHVDGGENMYEVTASTTGGTPAYSWNWSNGETDSTAKTLPNGSNTVTVVDANGCSFTFQLDVFSEYTGVGYLNNTAVYNIFPNPTTGNVNIELNLNTEDDVKVRVLNAVGKVIEIVEHDNVLQETISVDLAGQAVGIYFVETTVGSEKVVSRIQLTK